MLRKIIPYIPLSAITLTLLYTWLVFLTTDITYDTGHLAATILTLANIICYVARVRQRACKLITLGIIVLGCFNVLRFTPVTTSYWVGIGALQFYFQPYSYLLLLIFIICNYQSIAKYRK